MAETTKIAWCDQTFNPWIGCQRVSPGCEHCYAEQFARRSPALVLGASARDEALATGKPWPNALPVWGPQAPRRVTSAENWRQPLRWNKAARRDGVRRRVFCASLCDVFEDFGGEVTGDLRCWEPDLDDVREHLWALIEECSALDWLLLTKRPQNVLRMVESGRGWLGAHGWPRHVWVGTTVEDQRRAEERLPHLLRIPAPVRFVSAEPLLEEIDLRRWIGPPIGQRDTTRGIDWLIVGGESGPAARPFDLDWAHSLVQQCHGSTPCFVKQMGSNPILTPGPLTYPCEDPKGGDPAEWPADLRVRRWPEVRR